MTFKGRKHSEETKEKLCIINLGNEYGLGRKLSKKTKYKIHLSKLGNKNPNFGKKFTEEHKRKLSESHKGMLGKKHTEKTKRKISNKLKGREFTEEWRRKIGESRKGYKHTDKIKRKLRICNLNNTYSLNKKISVETKQKMRKATIKYIKEVRGNISPNIGRNEERILNEIELSLNKKIMRQFEILGYFVDGYCKELNLVIEIDENFHKQQLIKDKLRQKEIEKEMECKFLRISDLQ